MLEPLGVGKTMIVLFLSIRCGTGVVSDVDVVDLVVRVKF